MVSDCIFSDAISARKLKCLFCRTNCIKHFSPMQIIVCGHQPLLDQITRVADKEQFLITCNPELEPYDRVLHRIMQYLTYASAENSFSLPLPTTIFFEEVDAFPKFPFLKEVFANHHPPETEIGCSFSSFSTFSQKYGSDTVQIIKDCCEQFHYE